MKKITCTLLFLISSLLFFSGCNNYETHDYTIHNLTVTNGIVFWDAVPPHPQPNRIPLGYMIQINGFENVVSQRPFNLFLGSHAQNLRNGNNIIRVSASYISENTPIQWSDPITFNYMPSNQFDPPENLKIVTFGERQYFTWDTVQNASNGVLLQINSRYVFWSGGFTTSTIGGGDYNNIERRIPIYQHTLQNGQNTARILTMRTFNNDESVWSENITFYF